MVLKCKMCGGDLHPSDGATTVECEFCGSTQTIPRVDDEHVAQLYNRANHLRMQKEFDKAQMVYEAVAQERPGDAEAHWGALLCRYGIEYVEDPYSHERKPTLHRMQYDSILEDANFRAALDKADPVARDLYRREAELIDRILKRYQAISAKEPPFDVFICYKETDDRRQRTPDSVYAQEIYDALTREGYRVFFSRITLEDKLGEAYEPYIFAALNSARVMLVVGTQAAYMQADWVRNEWRRFLYLTQQHPDKKLIPVYRDMDAYELPEEFVYFQAQDYGKLGAIQDLVRGVEKIVGTKHRMSVEAPGASEKMAAPLLKRAWLFLEDKDWKSAEQYCEKVLDMDPENGRAYLGKLLASLKLTDAQQLVDEKRPFEQDVNYQKAVRFADPELLRTLMGITQEIGSRAKEADYVRITRRLAGLSEESSPEELAEAVKHLDGMGLNGYRDIDEIRQRLSQWHQQAVERESRRKEQELTSHREAAVDSYRRAKTAADWRDVLNKLGSSLMNDYPGIEEMRARAKERFEEQQAYEKCEKQYQQAVEACHRAGSSSVLWGIALDMLNDPELNGYKDIDELRKTASDQRKASQLAAAEKQREESERDAREKAERKERETQVLEQAEKKKGGFHPGPLIVFLAIAIGSFIYWLIQNE